MFTRLYIIGNGFDLAHGIHCRYQDFKEYCRTENPDIFRRIDLFYTDTDKLWSDFEAEMPNINEDRLFSWATALNPEWNQGWNGYYRFIDTIKDEVDYLRYLPYSFRDWVLKLDISRVRPMLRLYQGNSLFLSFNYTKVLEQVYSIPFQLVKHIHGVAEEDSSIIEVGHGRTDNEIDDMFDSDNDLELEACKEIKDLVIGWRKDTNRIIHQNAPFFDCLHNVTEIFVLGHSMASVDMPYFQCIKDSVQLGTMWTISVYDERDRQRKFQAVCELQLSSTNCQFIRLKDLSNHGRVNF